MFERILPSDHTFSNIFTISSRRPKLTFESIKDSYEAQKEQMLKDVVTINEIRGSDMLMESCYDYTPMFVASCIEKKIQNSAFNCEECEKVFYEDEKITDKFINFPVPCKSTFTICRHVEKFIKTYDFRKSNRNYKENTFKVLYCLIFRTLDFSTLFPYSEFRCDMSHKFAFIKSIVEECITIKAAYISNQVTLQQHKNIIRHQLNKMILRSGQ